MMLWMNVIYNDEQLLEAILNTTDLTECYLQKYLGVPVIRRVPLQYTMPFPAKLLWISQHSHFSDIKVLGLILKPNQSLQSEVRVNAQIIRYA